MNPRTDLDRDSVIEQLSRLDSSDPDNAASVQAPSTIRDLKAELDTIVGQLRQPCEPEPFASETGLRRAQELVLAIGLEQETKSQTKLPERHPPELGWIGPYKLVEKLGRGGMGDVYKAVHSSLEKVVALKVLPRELLNPAAIARFKREMKAVGKLDHTNIVRATDGGEADGDHFLVMEFVDGVDLAELLRRLGPLQTAEACELMRQAAVGLQHAHQRGLVHRDIKPSNLMLTWGDDHAPAVKVLDLGLALLVEQRTPSLGDLTSAGQMMGTLEYMSPEQCLDTHNVDIRADIYSLGATLFTLLCGKSPFAGERCNTPGKLLAALATQTPPSIGTQRSDLPTGLVELVDRLLSRSPVDRPATPAEVAQALAPFAIGADLRRLADVAQQPVSVPNKVPDQAITPTELLLSSPSTATKPDVGVEVVAESCDPRVVSEHIAVRKRAIPKQRVALALSGVLILLFGAVIYRVQTDKGTLVVEIDEQDAEAIEAKLKAGGLEVKDAATGRVFKLHGQKEQTERSGNYKLADGQGLAFIVEDADGLTVVTNEFKLTRGDRTRIRVTMAREGAVAGRTSRDTEEDPDRRATEWAASHGGHITVSHKGAEFDAKSLQELPKGELKLIAIYLHPDDTPGLNDEALAVFEGCRNIKSLALRGDQITDAGLAWFHDCKSLTMLSLQGTSVSDEGLANFKGCASLERLNLSDTQVSGAGFVHFTDCRNLVVVYFPYQVDDQGVAHLKNCTNLAHLYLGGATKVGDAGVECLEGMTKLELIDLNLTQVTNRGLGNLKKLTHLKSLSLEKTKITDAGLASLSGLTSLQFLNLDVTSITNMGLPYLSGLKELGELHLYGTEVTDEGLVHLRKLSSLTVLDLSQTKVTSEGVAQLHAALPQCKIISDHVTFEPTPVR